MYQQIVEQTAAAMQALCEVSRLKARDIVVVGCSSSEIAGHAIGSFSNTDLAQAVLKGLYPVLQENGLYLAAQCCEHLNRALVIESEAVEYYGLKLVNVLPQPKAGGSFSTMAYRHFAAPAVVSGVCAKAGMDIGDTLIGMHLARVAVPVRLDIKQIGEANLVCARTRPPFIGGPRAVYDDSLL